MLALPVLLAVRHKGCCDDAFVQSLQASLVID